MSRVSGFSVRIFIPTGNPEELRIVDNFNWTGIGLVFPRPLYAAVRDRDELKRAGVYVLWGYEDFGQRLNVYIGEGDPIRSRLDQHVKDPDKDFWTHAVVFVSKDQNLNKAHIKYLESRLVQLANDSKRANLLNKNQPQYCRLSEAEIVDAEGFLENMLLCLPIVGLNIFEKSKITDSGDLILRAKGVEARGVYTAEGFIVLAGSQAVKSEVPSIHSSLSKLRRELVETGVLTEDGDYYRFTEDYRFNSPSSAAGVVLGRSARGPEVWKDNRNRTLSQIMESQIAGNNSEV